MRMASRHSGARGRMQCGRSVRQVGFVIALIVLKGEFGDAAVVRVAVVVRM